MEMLATIITLAGSAVLTPILVFADRARVRRHARRQLEALAASLELETNGNDRVWGTRWDAAVTMSHRDSGSARSSTIVGTIAPRLDLALRIEPRWSWSVIPDTQRLFDDAAFDQKFVVLATESARAMALLDAPLRQLLFALSRHATVSVTDEDIRAELHQQTMATTGAALDTVARIVAHVRQRCAAVPPCEALAPHLDAWRRKANELGLDVTATPLSMFGEIDGGAVRATASPPHGSTTRETTDAAAPSSRLELTAAAAPSDPLVHGHALAAPPSTQVDLTAITARLEAVALPHGGSATILGQGVRMTLPHLDVDAIPSLLLALRDVAEEHAAITSGRPRRRAAYR